ncbi:DUF6491 family protein [Maricaulis sp. CAU 1757]
MPRHLTAIAAAATCLAAGLTLAAPAAAQSIRLVNVNGYNVLDREHLVLNGGASRHYLVTLRRSCFGLNHGVRVGLSFPATTTLHSPHMEYVTVADGPHDQRCYIDTIEQVEDIETARLLVEERAQAKLRAEQAGESR